MTARELTLSLLMKGEKTKQYSNIVLDNALKNVELSSADRGLVSALFYGVIERRITLDYQIKSLATRDISDIDEKTVNALRIGLYQLIYLDRIPPHAAINESVSLCSRKSAGFANAILRSFLRRGGISLPDKSNTLEYLSVAYSIDIPLLSRLLSIFGRDETEKLLTAINQAPPTTLRVNTLLTDRNTLIEKIPSSAPTKNAPHGIFVQGSVRDIYGFDEGMFFVQDEASQICVEALGAKSGDVVMDICACPGSKSFGAAITMKNRGEIYSFDLHENKLSLVINGAERLKIDIIQTSDCDGRHFLPTFEKAADRIICDVPCSGFGVLAKKPELRYKNPEESAALPKIQRDILNNACKYLKSGGTLIYSTCTILPEENEKNIEDFLASHPEFYLEEWQVGDIVAKGGMITLLPHIHKTDGFFIAKLKRK
jgi:16S rRNA (cytosine967-C5)-methyltransferase